MTLYARPKFRPEGDPIEHAARAFEAHPFATLIAGDRSRGDARMHAVHTPVLVTGTSEALVLHAHVARANAWWQRVEEEPIVLAIAHGPHAPISASWYAEPSAGTWNYRATHAHCEARTIHDEAELRPFLARLTSAFETDPAYQPDPSVVDRLVRAIVGVELRVIDVASTDKMSQNKDDQTHANIVEGLEARGEGDDEAVAAIMRAQR